MTRNQQETLYSLAWSVAITFFVIAAIMLMIDRSSTDCNAEDELSVTLNEDSFDYEAGDTFCIHIDTID